MRQIKLPPLSYTSFLHQTTTVVKHLRFRIDCLILLFYIKPQLQISFSAKIFIVLYFFSTSNHNSANAMPMRSSIVLYFFSTSNHNGELMALAHLEIVLYFFSTSNHNANEGKTLIFELSYTSFLHQTTTIFNYLLYFTTVQRNFPIRSADHYRSHSEDVLV